MCEWGDGMSKFLYNEEPNSSVKLLTLYKEGLDYLGYTYYEGNPLTNGCPFTFSQYNYDTSGSTDPQEYWYLSIPFNNDNTLLVICRGSELTLSGYSSNGFYIFYGIYYKDTDGIKFTLLGKESTTSYYYGYALNPSTTKAISIIATGTSVVIGDNVLGIWDQSAKKFSLYSYDLTSISIPNVVSDNLFTITINKPTDELGIALITFPDGRIGSKVFTTTLRIQNVDYYSLSTDLSNTITYIPCIY